MTLAFVPYRGREIQVNPDYCYSVEDMTLALEKGGMTPQSLGVWKDSLAERLALTQRVIERLNALKTQNKAEKFAYFQLDNQHFVCTVVSYDPASDRVAYTHYNSSPHADSVAETQEAAAKILRGAVPFVEGVTDLSAMPADRALKQSERDESSCGPLAILNAYRGLFGVFPSGVEGYLANCQAWEDPGRTTLRKGAIPLRAALIAIADNYQPYGIFEHQQREDPAPPPLPSTRQVTLFDETRQRVRRTAYALVRAASQASERSTLPKAIVEALSHTPFGKATMDSVGLALKQSVEAATEGPEGASKERLKNDLKMLIYLFYKIPSFEAYAARTKNDAAFNPQPDLPTVIALRGAVILEKARAAFTAECCKNVTTKEAAEEQRKEHYRKAMECLARGTMPDPGKEGLTHLAYTYLMTRWEYEENTLEPMPNHLYMGTGVWGHATLKGGFKVEQVFAHSPAERLGLRPGMTITHVIVTDANGAVQRNAQGEPVFQSIAHLSQSEMLRLIRGTHPHVVRMFKVHVPWQGTQVIGSLERPIYNGWCHAQYRMGVPLDQDQKQDPYQAYQQQKHEALRHLVALTDNNQLPSHAYRYVKREGQTQGYSFDYPLKKAAEMAYFDLLREGKTYHDRTFAGRIEALLTDTRGR